MEWLPTSCFAGASLLPRDRSPPPEFRRWSPPPSATPCRTRSGSSSGFWVKTTLEAEILKEALEVATGPKSSCCARCRGPGRFAMSAVCATPEVARLNIAEQVAGRPTSKEWSHAPGDVTGTSGEFHFGASGDDSGSPAKCVLAEARGRGEPVEATDQIRHAHTSAD
jgi:hypothetical protein